MAISMISRRKGVGVDTRPLLAPSVILLLVWMIVPLAMTIWFSFQYYNLNYLDQTGFAGFDNYQYLLEDPGLAKAILNTIILVVSVLAISVVVGVIGAVLLDQPVWGRGLARLFCIAPFFVMPTVSALVWKNLLMHPVNGLFAWISRSLGLPVIDWMSDLPLASVIIIVAWQWIPFALLILLTSLQSLDRDQIEAARMDGANGLRLFVYITLPHLYRAITIVVMIETIFLLSVFAEILVTTVGGPGDASTTLPYLIYKTALLDNDIGGASAGGMLAVVLANIVAVFLVRTISHTLED
ncbi:carbohydrate ABC transporter permease [Labrys monachus]|uniref:Sorbitol/mannitol transport system permease protein n=1 Tax=Labrys monachus TaxID=217067 RepID=A0ABU0FLM6_9HYPH|nr:sugar ABC transporter permease [Labrys monachus]MDQ0395024.1 sorbitol/mannitol transport system permease protein [Labrys monachus]